MAPVLIKHNNLGCDCLALCWNQLTDALLKNVHISAGCMGRLIYTSSWAKLNPIKLNDCYLNGVYVKFITGKIQIHFLQANSPEMSLTYKPSLL